MNERKRGGKRKKSKKRVGEEEEEEEEEIEIETAEGKRTGITSLVIGGILLNNISLSCLKITFFGEKKRTKNKGNFCLPKSGYL